MPPFIPDMEAKTYTFQVIGGSDDDGDDMPDAIQFLLRLKLEGAVVRQIQLVLRRRRRPTHFPRWLRRRVWLEMD
ncbi:unnamed protein product [Brassica napus]|uniref:(rape) hypothetical protein n=1 Tax=Brassica napus TaxID=3708 RepID=A0A816MZQ0_BRANA|nr:unnamed protein product [Brassica napus]